MHRRAPGSPGLEETRPSGNGRARGLLSDRASGARVEARTFAPPEDLAGLVETLWIGAWDLRGQPDHETQLLADPSVNLVFEWTPGEPATAQGRVVGVWTRLWTRTLSGLGRVRAAKLRPGAAGCVLDGAAARFTNALTPLPEPELVAAVTAPDRDVDGLHALVRWLRDRRRAHPRGHRAVALVDYARTHQITRVDTLAAHAGLTVRVRGLQRLFHTEVGASPKAVIRRYRLQELAVRVEAGEEGGLADLAFALGYADQAHMARDFRAATGRTLTSFARASR